MKFTAALEVLKAEHGIEGSELPYAFASEYLNDKNMIDYSYFTRKHKVHGSVKDFGKAVRRVFDTTVFTFTEPCEYITKAEFMGIYEFGKHPIVKRWIPEVAQRFGKSIRKQNLFEWVMSTSAPSKANFKAADINNID